MIGLLGNSTHLSFWYDEENGKFLISAVSKDDLDTYEIPPSYWRRRKHSCAMLNTADEIVQSEWKESAVAAEK